MAIDGKGEMYVTSVYRKETNKGHFMNAHGECPERYKVGMIRGLIDWTHKISFYQYELVKSTNLIKPNV